MADYETGMNFASNCKSTRGSSKSGDLFTSFQLAGKNATLGDNWMRLQDKRKFFEAYKKNPAMYGPNKLEFQFENLCAQIKTIEGLPDNATFAKIAVDKRILNKATALQFATNLYDEMKDFIAESYGVSER